MDKPCTKCLTRPRCFKQRWCSVCKAEYYRQRRDAKRGQDAQYQAALRSIQAPTQLQEPIEAPVMETEPTPPPQPALDPQMQAIRERMRIKEAQQAEADRRVAEYWARVNSSGGGGSSYDSLAQVGRV